MSIKKAAMQLRRTLMRRIIDANADVLFNVGFYGWLSSFLLVVILCGVFPGIVLIAPVPVLLLVVFNMTMLLINHHYLHRDFAGVAPLPIQRACSDKLEEEREIEEALLEQASRVAEQFRLRGSLVSPADPPVDLTLLRPAVANRGRDAELLLRASQQEDA